MKTPSGGTPWDVSVEFKYELLSEEFLHLHSGCHVAEPELSAT